MIQLKKTLGLPFFHKFQDLFLCRDALTINDFHQHWHILRGALDVQSRFQYILESHYLSPKKTKKRNRKI